MALSLRVFRNFFVPRIIPGDVVLSKLKIYGGTGSCHYVSEAISVKSATFCLSLFSFGSDLRIDVRGLGKKT